MASASSNKSRCTTCGKGSGIFICRGCSRDFCLSHAQEHRQALGEQMDQEVILVHDQLQQSLSEYLEKPDCHPLMKEINKWEYESIEKIRQVAQENRSKLLAGINKHTDTVKATLTTIKHQLKNIREDDDFFESDINQLKEKLDKLRKDFHTPQIITIKFGNDKNSFISKISINEAPNVTESFDKFAGDIKIQDEGRLIIHGNSASFAAVRGREEYSSGKHVLRFNIESMSGRKWILFAIVSKGAPIEERSYSTPTTYGWAGHNQVYLNGVEKLGLNGYISEIEKNYTFEFTIDCDNRKIHLKNEQTLSTYELDVDLNLCPFPWQINLNIFDANVRFRFLE